MAASETIIFLAPRYQIVGSNSVDWFDAPAGNPDTEVPPQAEPYLGNFQESCVSCFGIPNAALVSWWRIRGQYAAKDGGVWSIKVSVGTFENYTEYEAVLNDGEFTVDVPAGILTANRIVRAYASVATKTPNLHPPVKKINSLKVTGF